jgi:glutaminase
VEELPFETELAELHQRLLAHRDGSVATYIPALAHADADAFGLAVVTVDGYGYHVGDAHVPFTIQSVSKPFVFGMALDDIGIDTVMERVGVEPTGDAFNSITVDEVSGRPFNPMVNAGAIVTTNLLRGTTATERQHRLLAGLDAFAGRTLTVDEEVCTSEQATGDRNRAIAYLMRSSGMLHEEVDDALDAYFRQCSVLVDTYDLAVMGATLANHGVNPLTQQRAIAAAHVPRVLSVMSTCGMYDYAGEWLYQVGLPAKSGVSGGVVAVLPGQLAVASYSPRLDPRGNSTRGIAACGELARRFRLHVFDAYPSGPAPVRQSYDLSAVRSKRYRNDAETAVLRTEGSRAMVVEVQGPLHFASAEVLSRWITRRARHASHVLLDFRRVSSFDDGAAGLLSSSIARVNGGGAQVVASDLPDEAWAPALWDALIVAGASVRVALDDALEQCENELLSRAGLSQDDAVVDLRDHDLLRDLPVFASTWIEREAPTHAFPKGATVFRAGDPSDAVYLVVSGRVAVHLDTPEGAIRVATIGAGSAFGEMAAIDGLGRSSTIEAEADCICRTVDQSMLDRLERAAPGASITLYRNIARVLARRLRDANDEILALQH